MEYREVQQIAKDTIAYAKRVINPGMNLLQVRKLCEQKMLELGADSFWYWDIGAFVFAGDETTISVSGKQYITSNRTIAENDIITIDLSPQNGNIWGDYARTIIIENGVVVDKADVCNEEWKNGLLMGNSIPAPAFGCCMTSVLACKLGNIYGISWDAQQYLDEILKTVSKDRWIYYLGSVLQNDRVILYKLTIDNIIDRWIDVVEKYNLYELDAEFSKDIKDILQYSNSTNKRQLKMVVNRLLLFN